MNRIVLTAILAGIAACGTAERETPGASTTYDIVISGGRVIDPESGLDAIRNVGITEGSIAAISTEPMQGSTTIDASGLVVSPGFIFELFGLFFYF